MFKAASREIAEKCATGRNLNYGPNATNEWIVAANPPELIAVGVVVFASGYRQGGVCATCGETSDDKIRTLYTTKYKTPTCPKCLNTVFDDLEKGTTST